MAPRPSPPSALSLLWRHRSLWWQFTIRAVELKHKGSHLGLAWSILNPLLLLALYTFVFGFIFGGRFDVLPNESRLDYALGIFLGLSLFHFLGETIGLAPTIIVGNPNFVKKVVFPLEVLPAAGVGASCFHLIISLSLLLLGVAFLGGGLTLGALWLPIILLPLVAIALGMSWFLSALGVFFRDLVQITQFVALALMFSSAVFYPADQIPAPAWQILRFNPLLLAIELSRDAVLWHQAFNFTYLAGLYAWGFISLLVGGLTFARLKPAFADVL